MVDNLLYCCRPEPRRCTRDAIDLKRVTIPVVFAVTPCSSEMWNTGQQAHVAMAHAVSKALAAGGGILLPLGAGHDPAASMTISF
jgi:Na+-transporting NADH:ubiquinone oxidoreductase subunit NqrB